MCGSDYRKANCPMKTQDELFPCRPVARLGAGSDQLLCGRGRKALHLNPKPECPEFYTKRTSAFEVYEFAESLFTLLVESYNKTPEFEKEILLCCRIGSKRLVECIARPRGCSGQCSAVAALVATCMAPSRLLLGGFGTAKPST